MLREKKSTDVVGFIFWITVTLSVFLFGWAIGLNLL
jgi:hypothetical protein